MSADRLATLYYELNNVVAILTLFFPSGTRKEQNQGWNEDWENCVYIDLPTGQVSWHYRDSYIHLFEHLPLYTKEWDGHTTAEKYNRLRSLLSMRVAENAAD